MMKINAMIEIISERDMDWSFCDTEFIQNDLFSISWHDFTKFTKDELSLFEQEMFINEFLIFLFNDSVVALIILCWALQSQIIGLLMIENANKYLK